MQPFNWTCPYCNRPQTVTEEAFSNLNNRIYVGKTADDPLGVQIISIGCVNAECKRTSITCAIGTAVINNGSYRGIDHNRLMFSERLMPRGTSRPQPGYIPSAIREDYEEACLIMSASPKAAATLVRRCLQGMIRDFAGISKATLAKEIEALRSAVADGTADRSITPESVEAIDQVRKVGNIGAHMERDIGLIIPVDAGEAQALIELVEMLFEEWYVARHTRQSRLLRIQTIAADKDSVKQGLGVSVTNDQNSDQN